MFGLFKKKTAKQTPKVEDMNILSDEERRTLFQKIETEKEAIIHLSDTDQLAEAYERLGLLYGELEMTDEAIAHLEKSLETKLSMADGYKKLMSLYNTKRAQAARSGDDKAIDYYMNKMDEMRNIAKKLTLSR